MVVQQSIGRAAYEVWCAHDLSQIVNGLTHRSKNRLDFIITDAQNISSVDHNIGTSDHYLMQCTPLSETPP